MSIKEASFVFIALGCDKGGTLVLFWCSVSDIFWPLSIILLSINIDTDRLSYGKLSCLALTFDDLCSPTVCTVSVG